MKMTQSAGCSVTFVFNAFVLLGTSGFFTWGGLAAPSRPLSQQPGSWDGEGDHSLGSPLTPPPWLCLSRKEKKITDSLSVNHDGPPAKEVGAVGPGNGGHRGAESPRGLRGPGSQGPAVSVLPHAGAEMTAQRGAGRGERGGGAALGNKTPSSLCPLVGSRARGGRGGGQEPPHPLGSLGFWSMGLEV